MQRGWVLALGVAAVGLAGCGGGSSSNSTANFKSGYQSAVAQFKTVSTSVGNAVEGAAKETDAQLQSEFKTLAGNWQTQLSKLQNLKPPSNVQDAFNTLKDALARVETDLNAVVSAAATHSQSAGEQAGASLVGDLTAARAADTSIRKTLGLPSDNG